MSSGLLVKRCEIVVPVPPVAAARARGGRNGHYTPTPYRQYLSVVCNSWIVAGRPRLPDGVPLRAECTFYVERPPSHLLAGGKLAKGKPVFPIYTPDLDNLVKALLDGVTDHDKRGPAAIRDDAPIVELVARKRYAVGDVEPCAVLALEVCYA